MITPTFEYNYYKTHRGICVNGDCENVIRDYVSNHYKNKIVKAIISDALFYERKQFLNSSQISVSSQCRAIKDFSTTEFNSVCSIIQDGKSVKNLILKIGNVLSEYHKDKLVRYPETTQFVYDLEKLSADGRAVVDTAESWALIKRRKEKQRLSAGVGQEGYLCAINRVFAPIFNISYRIRGGVNIIWIYLGTAACPMTCRTLSWSFLCGLKAFYQQKSMRMFVTPD